MMQQGPAGNFHNTIFKNQGESVKLQSAVTATGAGAASQPYSGQRTFQAILTGGAGTLTATVSIQVSNEITGPTNWLTLGTITLSGTGTQTDGFSSDAPWKWVRSNVTAISGTSASVDVLMGQ